MCTCVCVSLYVCVCESTCMHACVCTCVYLCVCMCTSVCVCMCVCVGVERWLDAVHCSLPGVYTGGREESGVLKCIGACERYCT